MRQILDDDRAALFCGDSAELELPENSVDAIVTDPPAGIGFMGKEWDTPGVSNYGFYDGKLASNTPRIGAHKGNLKEHHKARDLFVKMLAGVMSAQLRFLKPGGHGLVWALPRTSHWTALALEEAGFEIRDRVSHLFGTGFPKSLTSASAEIPESAGTALKPAVEDWWLVKKPHRGMSVEECFKRYGTGVIWIGACRVGTDDTRSPTGNRPDNGWGMAQGVVAGSASGRWPAHLVLDEEAAELLDQQAGERRTGGRSGMAGVTLGYHGGTDGYQVEQPIPPSSGGASRFFYVAKGSRAEKDAGLDHLPAKTGGEATGRKDGAKGVSNPRVGAGRTGGARNHHPTVKSIALMRWLCRLVTPPGGIVLDPFAGSGSTGVAALAEGMQFVGCEMTEDYLPILEGRIRHALADRAGEPER